MNAYADAEFYTESYLTGRKGVVDAASFPFYARKATQEIHRYISGNVDDDAPPECVRMCCCEVAELLYTADKSAGKKGGKASESVGTWSVSYETGKQAEQTLKKKIRESVYAWMSGTGLLYRGRR